MMLHSPLRLLFWAPKDPLKPLSASGRDAEADQVSGDAGTGGWVSRRRRVGRAESSILVKLNLENNNKKSLVTAVTEMLTIFISLCFLPNKIHAINTLLLSNQGVCHADRLSTAYFNFKRSLHFYGSRRVWKRYQLKSKARIPARFTQRNQ